MQVRFLLGPAGSGKTFRCLTDIRHALTANQDGPPLLLVVPQQTTYQLERQLLADSSLPGYTRLHILSFERLAEFIFIELKKTPPRMIAEEGRLMVLRALLAKRRDELKLFHGSARLTGFAQHLNQALRELQRHQLTPDKLRELANQVRGVEGLAYKLHDLATLLGDYLNWLDEHDLQDGDRLLDAARAALAESPESRVQNPESKKSVVSGQLSVAKTTDYGLLTTDRPAFRIESLWLDGFAELSPQELDLLVALLPHCGAATFSFCLDRVPAGKISWLSNWSMMRRTYEECRKRLAGLPDCNVEVELLPRHPNKGRFLDNPVLLHLEKNWAEPIPFAIYDSRFASEASSDSIPPDASRITDHASSLRIAICASPEAEATLAAREIIRFAREGGRYREVAVLVRKLEGYHDALQRVFARYEIPFFLDRRELVAHHPLAELTRNALRTVALGWARDDWFAALKTGLVPVDDVEIDRLENEALARGWKTSAWQQPIKIKDEPELEEWAERLRQKIVPPFQKLALQMALQQNKPTGTHLAEALREFWTALNIERQLQDWATACCRHPADSSASETLAARRAFRQEQSAAIHLTVWDQMHAWLDNVELAFSNEALTLREWLPILDAGLANFTVGVIPPALDQVLIGSIDRSRNPDIKLALVLGVIEAIFPAPPESSVLLTDTDREELERQNISLSANARQQLGRERFYGYVAFTRARERLVLTAAVADANGKPLNPSPFLSQVQRLFPGLKIERVPKSFDLLESEHSSELIVPLLKNQVQGPKSKVQSLFSLHELAALAPLRESLQHFAAMATEESLSPELAEKLYGQTLRTSVSRMEQFAACPFKFFVHSGMRAEERELFELDVREQGSFQHDVLRYFHLELQEEKKRWRDITPVEARERIKKIASGMMASYRDGLLQATEEGRFTARILTESLQDFVETQVGWMRGQYEFDPVAAEVPFGEEESSPAWELDLGGGHRLALHGRIDRVDICREADRDEAHCVVIDYKSGQKQLDAISMAHGLQLQLAAYLNVLRHWPDPRSLFGVSRLIPAGVFYVNLRGRYKRGNNRTDALADPAQTRKLAYQHTGRFDTGVLRKLDRRPDATAGDQFNYRLTKDGKIYKSCRDTLETAEFEAMLDLVETNLKEMGQKIFAGVAQVDPYRKGTTTACDQCDYQSICRIDPWTHRYRVLKKTEDDV